MKRVLYRTGLVGVLSMLLAGSGGLRSAFCAEAAGIVEPRLEIMPGHRPPHVALTLDLCMGRTDDRILDVLLGQKIPATLFVTEKWLRNNADVVRVIRAHPDLFEIGNHGADHIPPVDDRPTVYGLKTAGNPERICEEVTGGMKAIERAGLASLAPVPRWYRGATALYSPHAIPLIEKLGFRIAGFSLNGDKGASLMASEVAERIKTAKDGDVIIAHMNQPTRVSGIGVVEGILALKRKGYRFVKLSEGAAAVKTGPAMTYHSCAEALKGSSVP